MKVFLPALVLLALTAVALPEGELQGLTRELFELANAERRAHGLAPCSWNPALALAGQRHSQDMCEKDFFDHASPVMGRHTVAERVAEAGGPPGVPAENLFWASGLAARQLPMQAMAEWTTSKEHSDNLYNPKFNAMGVGIFHMGDQFWVTQVFTP